MVLRQYLYFCASKTSKLSACRDVKPLEREAGVELEFRKRPHVQDQRILAVEAVTHAPHFVASTGEADFETALRVRLHAIQPLASSCISPYRFSYHHSTHYSTITLRI